MPNQDVGKYHTTLMYSKEGCERHNVAMLCHAMPYPHPGMSKYLFCSSEHCVAFVVDPLLCSFVLFSDHFVTA